MPSPSRVGALLIATLIAGLTGCNQGTEIPLAKVAPVTLSPAPPQKGAPRGSIVSPDVLPNR